MIRAHADQRALQPAAAGETKQAHRGNQRCTVLIGKEPSTAPVGLDAERMRADASAVALPCKPAADRALSVPDPVSFRWTIGGQNPGQTGRNPDRTRPVQSPCLARFTGKRPTQRFDVGLLAMQKVEGSSPFSRSPKGPANRTFRARSPASTSSGRSDANDATLFASALRRRRDRLARRPCPRERTRDNAAPSSAGGFGQVASLSTAVVDAWGRRSANAAANPLACSR